MAPGGKKGRKEKYAAVSSSTGGASEQQPILDDIPAPIASVDLSDIDKLPQSYETCVGAIIEAMKEDSGTMFTFVGGDGAELCKVPVTPGPDSSPSGVYVIELKDGETKLQLVADKYQAWFRGIVTNTGARFEIDGFTPKIMAGSQSLHTSARYYDLLGKTVAGCRIGFQSFLESFYRLSRHDGQQGEYRVAIAVLLVMLFEAPRFDVLLQLSKRLPTERRDEAVGEENKISINNWSDTCKDFYAANGDEELVTITDKSSEAIKKVAANVRILCRSKWDRWLEKQQEETVQLRRKQ